MASRGWLAGGLLVLLLAPAPTLAHGPVRGHPLWTLPAVAASTPVFPLPAPTRGRARGPAGRALSLWDVRSVSLPTPPIGPATVPPAPLSPAWQPARLRPATWISAPTGAAPYRALAARHAARFGLPLGLVLAVIQVESNFNPAARSSKDAQGLMQLVPDTGGVEALRYVTGNPWVAPPTPAQLADPDVNLLLGTAYLRLVLEQLPGHLPWEVRRDLALAAYNWGPDRVITRLLGSNPPLTLAETRARLDRLAPPETRQYVRRVTELLPFYGGDGLALEAAGWGPRLAGAMP